MIPIKFLYELSPAQWQWLLERFAEGYRLQELADWLGVHPRTLSRCWDELGLRLLNVQELPPLSQRRREFDALANQPLPPAAPELGERLALAMLAGARAIDHNGRLAAATYIYDFYGEISGPKEISYCEASRLLREAGEARLP